MSDPAPDVLAIFTEAIALESAEARREFVDGACGGDAQVRQQVETLLRAHFDAGNFLGGGGRMTTPVGPAMEQPGDQIGSYKLLQQIGEGGFGVVYMAEQTAPICRKVALKIIKPGMDSKQVVARFEAERQALALMSHPNIAQVFDGGTTGSGRPYFVMELVRGVTLTEYCDKNHLPMKQRLELFVTVCRAIQHAHQKGVIHRDIKPSNVMVTLHDGVPVPKVIDFGVSKAISQRLTEKTMFTTYGQMIGTPAYMSPEQAETSGLDIDTRSDIYSLGVLLYELLTDNTPFDKQRLCSAAFDEMLRIIREEEPLRPSTKLSSSERLASIAANRKVEPQKLSAMIRGELDWIVMKALEKDRGRRYESAGGFAADVEHYLHDEPVQACPPSTVYQLRKFLRRNKRGLGATALVVFFVVALGSVIGWSIRDRQLREQAVERKAQRDLALTDQSVRQSIERATRIRDELHAMLARPGGVQELLNQPGRWMFMIQSAQSELAQARRSAARAEGGLSAESNQALDKLGAQLAGDEADRTLALLLERIRLDRATWVKDRFDDHQADAEYTQAFAGLAVLKEDAATVAARLRSSPIHEQLVAALDDWAYVAFSLGKQAMTEQLLAVARQAAPDPGWGDRLRQVNIWRDQETLGKLADEAPLTRLSPQMLALVGYLLPFQCPPQESWLRRAQARYPADFWLNFHLAVALEQTQPLESAGFYRAALAVRPANGATHNNLGNVLARQGKLDEAIASYRKAIEVDPELAQAHINLGVELANRNKLDEAIACYRKAIEVDPRNAGAHCRLGVELANQNKLDEAIAAYRKAIKLDPNSVLAHINLGADLQRQNKLDEAIAAFRKAIELDPELAMAHYNLGVVLQRQNKLDEAIDAYRRAIELDPNDASAHCNLGASLARQNKLDEAIDAYRRVIDLDPELPMAHCNLGVALQRQNKLDEAIAAFRKAIELDPTYGNAHCNLGIVLQRQNKLDEAIDAYRKAIELDPRYAKAHKNLGAAFSEQGKLDEAIAAYHRAIELDPNDASVHYNLGTALERTNKLVDAINAYREAIELDAKHAKAHCNLGVVLQRQNKLDEAIDAFRKAIEVDPELATAHYNLGVVLQRQNKLDDAIDAFRKAIELDPELAAMVHCNLGNLLTLQNKLDEAIDAYRRAIELDPKYTHAHKALVRTLATRGWELANQPRPEARNLEKAVASCQEAIKLDPQSRYAWHRLAWVQLRAGEWQKSIEAMEQAGKLLANGTGDATEWIVLALAHGQLAADPGLPQPERMQHQTQARQWYEKADRQISARWSARPERDPTVWDFREEAKKLLGIETQQPEAGK